MGKRYVTVKLIQKCGGCGLPNDVAAEARKVNPGARVHCPHCGAIIANRHAKE